MTCVPRTYDDILADILGKRHSRCVCPHEYLPPHLSPRSKPTTPCNFGPNCQFETGPLTRTYDSKVCTCAQCTCEMGLQVPSPPPALSQSSPGCTCPGLRLCKTENDLILKCEKPTCVCSYCTCELEISSPNLLPTLFRTVLRNKGLKMMTDQEMTEERQEIKQVIDEVSASVKDGDVEDKKVLKRKKSKTDKLDEDSGLKEELKQVDDSPKQSLKSAKAAKVSITVPVEQNTEIQTETSIKKQSQRMSREAPSKKSKKPKSHRKINTPTSTKSKIQYRSRMRTTEKKKTLRIRYYYAGGVESYGVKLGHGKCLEKPVSVPKNMGWLWNIEDPSKGIRERKGWPPGFIGKNIKNMIKVMKMFDNGDPVQQRVDTKELKRWKTQPDTRATPDEHHDEPPLLHIHKKGRTYDITFCPKSSDTDIGPVPIPFSITQKKQNGDSETDDSSLELEFHSPIPRADWELPKMERKPSVVTELAKAPPAPRESKPPSTKGKKKKKKKSVASEENRNNNWEDQPTQIENVP